MQIARARSAWRSSPASSPSSSTIRQAPASVGKPNLNAASTAWITSWSIISSAAGTMPAAMIPETVLVASSTLLNTASIVRTAGGCRTSRAVTSVTTPKVPSEPQTIPVRS